MQPAQRLTHMVRYCPLWPCDDSDGGKAVKVSTLKSGRQARLLPGGSARVRPRYRWAILATILGGTLFGASEAASQEFDGWCQEVRQFGAQGAQFRRCLVVKRCGVAWGFTNPYDCARGRECKINDWHFTNYNLPLCAGSEAPEQGVRPPEVRRPRTYGD
jgi:hypothetical protein